LCVFGGPPLFAARADTPLNTKSSPLPPACFTGRRSGRGRFLSLSTFPPQKTHGQNGPCRLFFSTTPPRPVPSPARIFKVLQIAVGWPRSLAILVFSTLQYLLAPRLSVRTAITSTMEEHHFSRSSLQCARTCLSLKRCVLSVFFMSVPLLAPIVPPVVLARPRALRELPFCPPCRLSSVRPAMPCRFWPVALFPEGASPPPEKKLDDEYGAAAMPCLLTVCPGPARGHPVGPNGMPRGPGSGGYRSS